VTFEFGSRLQVIDNKAFEHCTQIRTICLPASLHKLGEDVFRNCFRLSQVTFESPSQLKRIELGTFEDCCDLASFCIPAGVEFVGNYCFQGCIALSALVFEQPSYLRELLSLPTGSLIVVDLPDSVEVFTPFITSQSERLTINFGAGSKLREIRGFARGTIARPNRIWVRRVTFPMRAFINLPAHRVKALRCEAEFP
jgi:hypothetical protein